MALAKYTPHYTVEDYEQWDGDWELWSGVAVSMSPSAKRRHQRVSKRLVALLDGALEKAGCKECEALQDIDWRVSGDTVFRPDVLIACGDLESDWIRETPALVAEILSDSTRERDLSYKKLAYQSLGVNYYLVVEPRDSTFALFQMRDELYQPSDSHVLELGHGCRIEVDLGELFPA